VEIALREAHRRLEFVIDPEAGAHAENERSGVTTIRF
jgi:hypothetical protein